MQTQTLQMRFETNSISKIMCENDKQNIHSKNKPKFWIFKEGTKKPKLRSDYFKRNIGHNLY